MKIPVFGTVFIDIKGHPYQKFIPDGRNAGWIETVHGGVGRNIAEDLAALGADCVFVSLAPTGGTGDEIIARLNDAGVDTRFTCRSKNGHGTWLAVFNEKGDVVSSISARADLTPLCSVIDEHHAEIFENADIVIIEVDIDTPVVEKAMQYAKQYGVKVCCAVATMSQALDKAELIKDADLFICNLQEAGMLFDVDLAVLAEEEFVRTMSADAAPEDFAQGSPTNAAPEGFAKGSPVDAVPEGFAKGSPADAAPEGFIENSPAGSMPESLADAPAAVSAVSSPEDVSQPFSAPDFKIIPRIPAHTPPHSPAQKTSGRTIAFDPRYFTRKLPELIAQKKQGILAANLPKLMREKGIRQMIVTMSAQGSVYASADGQFGICPSEKVTPVDTTGAGDSYCAGVAAALSKGFSMEEACRIGAKVAARVVSSNENVYHRDSNEEKIFQQSTDAC